MNFNELKAEAYAETYAKAYATISEAHPEWDAFDTDEVADVVATGWEGAGWYQLRTILGRRVIWAGDVAEIAAHATRRLMRVLPDVEW